MSGPIAPALTPEEWERGRVDFAPPTAYSDWIEQGYYLAPSGRLVYGLEVEGCDRDMEMERPHALAALALHGQPFGFTPQMADAIRVLIAHARRTAQGAGPQHALWESIFDAEAATERIAALLPQREP